MNSARLTTYQQGLQAHIEARRRQFAFKTVAPKDTSDPVDVDSFGRGGEKELLLENSSPTMAAHVCKERLKMGE